MANMSYCRFENTLSDMRDCLVSIGEAGGLEDYVKEYSPSEFEARAIKAMFEVAEELAQVMENAEEIDFNNYGGEDE